MPDDPAEALTDRYNREAHAYRDLWAPILRNAGLRLLHELAGAETFRVVDVGTGVGALLPDLRTTFPSALVVGVDRAHGMLRLAPAETPRVVMDARDLAIRGGSVDLVLLVFMLFHLDEPGDGLREARRVLRHGGRVATLTWGEELESKASRLWNRCLDAYGAAVAGPATAARHDAVDTPEKVDTLLRAAGFNAPRSWSEELVATLDREHLLRLKTSMGSAKPRLDSLAPPAREDCVADARGRMRRLSRDDFTARGRIVCAVATA